MQKIVAMLRVKDGKLFINDWLGNIEKLVDEIVVVDNGSTDGTYELLKAHSNVIEVAQTEGFHEGRDKIILYQMARKRKPDWCLWLDVDEIFEKAMTRDKIKKLITNNRINSYFFRRFHFVNNKCFNADWQWIKYTAGFDRVLWREQNTGYFENIKFNNGLIKGILGRKTISHYRLKHLGYTNKKEVYKKIGIYRKVDAGLENIYKSMIFSNPRTIKWDEYYGLAKLKVFVLNLLLDCIFIFMFLIRKIKN